MLALTLRQDHSDSGPLHLTYGDSWRPDIADIFIAAEQSGLGTNKDLNSGNVHGQSCLIQHTLYQLI
jgi:hypothetical protein